MVRPIIHSTKHYKQDSLFAVTGGTLVTKTIINAVDVAAKTSVNEVEEGASIKAVYLEYWITGDDAVQGTAIVTVEKLPAAASTMTAAQSALLQDYPNKKNVLHTFMGLMPPNTQYPSAVLKGWFKIPKGKQRFGLGDKLVVNFHGQSDGLSACGFAIYKEYT